MPTLRKKRTLQQRSQEESSDSSSDNEDPPTKRLRTENSQKQNGDATETVQVSESEDESDTDFQEDEDEDEDDDSPLEFRRGSITRVRVRNFMTYDDAEFHPGPRLNLILGPNGTGKSSFVNALCIGLAGNPRLLGRATDAKSYIKQGKERALIEIELSYDATHTIRIGVTITHRGSQWKINDQPTSKSKVEPIIKKLNIRLDNLTQFLPQDRVAHFAGLTPIQLLQETQEAVLDASVAQDYKRLCEIRRKHKGSADKLEKLQNKLDQLKRANEMLEADVQRFKERQAHLKKVHLLKVKVAHVRHSEVQRHLLSLRSEISQYRKELEEMQNKEIALKKEKEAFQRQFHKLDREQKSLLEKLKRSKENMSQYKQELQSRERQLVKVQEELKLLHEREKEREGKIKKYEQLVQQKQNELNELTPQQELHQQMKEKQEEIRKWTQKHDAKHYQTAELQSSVRQCDDEISRLNERLRELENHKNQRLQLIRQAKPQVFEAYQWITQNKHRFDGNVAIPALEVDIKEDEFGKYLEKCIPDRILFGLVCEHDKDRELLIEELAQKKNLSRLTILLQKKDDSSNAVQHPESLEDLRSYGIKCFLDETFETSSPVVKDVLVRLANLSQVAIGTQNTEYSVDSLFSNTRVRMVCTPDKRYHCVTSRYDPSVKSSSVIQLRAPRLFTSAYSEEIAELREQRNEYNAKRSQLNQQLNKTTEEERQIYQQTVQLESEKKVIDRERKKHRALRSEIESRQMDIKNLREQDIEEEEATKRRQIRDINRNRFNAVKKFTNTTTRLLQMSMRQDVLDLCRNQFDQDEQEYTQQIEQMRNQIVDIESNRKRIEEDYKERKQELLERKRNAQEKLKQYVETHHEDEDEVKEQLTQLADTEVELRDEIQREQAEADSIYHDAEAITQYERRKVEIEEVSRELEEYQQDKEQNENAMLKLKQKWLKPLRKCVKQINREFMQFTENLGIEGRVELGEEGDEFDQYKIVIKVKFREGEDMAPLNAQRQSGGERSVTTILYLLSLQRLNKCPFRVVDEINQGMDPKNERAIFMEILRCSKGKNTPQCFLITPKLLSNLVPPDRNITVLFIYNGIGNLTQSQWDHFRQQFQKMIAENSSSITAAN